MMSLIGMGGMEMFVVLLFYSGVGLPLGVPPAEEDPLMTRIAPAECLYYTTWAGMAQPDAENSPTEALMAEEEVQELVKHLDTTLRAVFLQLAEESGDDDFRFLADAGPLMIKSLVTCPTAIYLTKFQMERGAAPQIEGGAIVNTGDDTAEIREALLKFQGLAGDDIDVEEVEIGGATFYQFQPDPDAPLITWGTRGKYLLFGLGEESIENMFASARTAAPAWLTELQDKLPVQRRSTMTYANIRSMVETGLAATDEGDVADARRIIAALGLGNVESYSSVTGLDKEGFVNRTVVSLDGEARGIFKLADAKPLTAEDVATMPADSTIAFALRLDGKQVLDLVQ